MTTKKIKACSIDENIAIEGEQQAKKERRSFSSLVEYLLAEYLASLKNGEKTRNLVNFSESEK